MRASIKNYMDALKRRREEHGEEGFSLIELIVVVVILGILAAIAIPIFLNIQQQAKENAAMSVASTGATQAAAQIAQSKDADVSNLVTGDATAVGFVPAAAPTTIEAICVTATVSGVTAQEGPGCTTTGVIP